VEVLQRNNAAGRETTLILPVGPLQYEPLAELCNREKIDLSRLTIFMMDEYLQPDGSAIPTTHPLSFRAFMQRSLLAPLDLALGFSEDRMIFPLPEVAEEISERILGQGGVDLCFAGIGISGHLAFNDPRPAQDPASDLEWARNCTTRRVVPSDITNTQYALAGTHGNWALIPREAATLGMKEILASRTICLTLLRTWHSGVMRRTLFGPVSGDWPASLIQEHPQVEVLMTEVVAAPPLINTTLDTAQE
jgi:glucosamine-6-phosphate deaminase